MGIRVQNKWGWLITLCIYIIEIPTFGILSSFAVVYIQLIEEFSVNDFMVAWIGSLAWMFTYVLAPVCTLLFMKFGHRITTFFGVALCSLGLLSSSFVPRPEYLFLTFSLLYGAGANFIENAAINLIAEYFPKKNSARATVFQFLGQSTGFLVMNPLMIYICNEIGWRRAFQVMAISMVIIGSITAAMFRPSPFAKSLKTINDRLKETRKNLSISDGELGRKKSEDSEDGCLQEQPLENSMKIYRPLVSVADHYLQTLRETIMVPGIMLWNLGNVLMCIPISFAYVTLLRYLTSRVSENTASQIYIILGAFDVLSRLFFFVAGDFLPFKTIFTYPVACISGGVVLYSLLANPSFAGLVVFAIVTGTVVGTLTSMNFKIPLDLFGNLIIAEVWSLTIVSVGVGCLAGPLIAGAILDNIGSFDLFFHVGSVCYFLAAICFLAIPFWQNYRGWTPKNLHTPRVKSGSEIHEINGLPVIDEETNELSVIHVETNELSLIYETNEISVIPLTTNTSNEQSAVSLTTNTGNEQSLLTNEQSVVLLTPKTRDSSGTSSTLTENT